MRHVIPSIRWPVPLLHWLRLEVRSNVRNKTRSITTNLVFRLPADSPRLLPFLRPFRDLDAAVAPPQTR
jgi:hypothetical protein